MMGELFLGHEGRSCFKVNRNQISVLEIEGKLAYGSKNEFPVFVDDDARVGPFGVPRIHRNETNLFAPS